MMDAKKNLCREITIEGEVEDEHTKFLWGNADIVNVEISPPGEQRLSSAILRTDAEKAVKNQADFLDGKECRHVAWTATPGKSQCLTCGIFRTQNPNGTWR